MSQLVPLLVSKIWQGRTKNIVLGIFFFLLALMAVSWLALPSYVKRIAAEQVQQQLGRKLEIAEISSHP